MPIPVADFARQQLDLLAAEQAAEVSETATAAAQHSPAALQRAGAALTNLSVGSTRTGFGGRTVVELVPDAATSSTGELPAEHGIRTGDVVLVSELAAGGVKKREVKEMEKKGVRGVVTRVGKGSVSVAVDEEKEDAVDGLKGRVWIVRLADEVTYKRWVTVPLFILVF